VFVLAVLLAVSPSLVAQRSVRLVAPGVPGAFDDVQAAVDAAVNGDVILVRTSATSSFVVDGKSLTILGDLPTAPVCGDPIGGDNTMGGSSGHNVIRNLVSGQVTTVRGLELGGLEVRDVLGAVWIEDCTINRTAPAMRAKTCARLTLTGVTIDGPDGSVDPGAYDVVSAGRALELTQSRVIIRDTTLRGGDGQPYTVTPQGDLPNGPGQEAVRVTGGTLWLAGCVLQGGEGGAGGADVFGACTDGSAGGKGLRLGIGSPQVTLQATALHGGAGGAAATTGCLIGSSTKGADGLPLDVVTGAVEYHALRVADLRLTGSAGTAAIREQEPMELVVTGQPKDFVLLLVAGVPGMSSPKKLVGSLLVGTPLTILWIGSVGPNHELSVSLVAPELGPGLSKVELYLQAVILPSERPLVGSDGTALVLLDASL
jgi:hypothetical protein